MTAKKSFGEIFGLQKPKHGGWDCICGQHMDWLLDDCFGCGRTPIQSERERSKK